MTKEIALAEIKGRVGTEMGVSDWITVDQTMINAFGKATLDEQFIHMDPSAPVLKALLAARLPMGS